MATKKKASNAKPAGTRSASKKRASTKGSKQSSKKSTRKRSKQNARTQVGITSLTHPTTDIESLAKWAVDRKNGTPANTKKFRKDAAGSTGFGAALDKAVQDYGAPNLTDEERTYCEGWLYLARVVHHDSNADKFDKKLKKAVEKHLDGDGGKWHVMTG